MQYLAEWQQIDADAGEARMTPEQVDRLLADVGISWKMTDEDMEGDAIVMAFRLVSTDQHGKRVTASFSGLKAGVLAPLVFGREHPDNTFPTAHWLLMQLPWSEEQSTFEDWLEDAFGSGQAPRPGSAPYRQYRAEYVRRERHYKTVGRFFDAVDHRLGGDLNLWRCLWAASGS
jgi:hypothetical protein